MRARSLLALALLVGAASSGAATTSYKPPVAVLPFKNLNAESASDWLKLGVAETMLSDLKKAKVAVVERDQIDKALGELLLRGDAGSEDGQATQVGKMVGAKTVVVGSFQAAGKQLRFNARFVDVETGVILDTAKTTGPIDQVFALQDQVVDKLLGGDAAKAARPARKTGAKTVEAYKLYAMSLATASDAERVGLLKKSIALDPAFVYAADELAALEKRLGEYAKLRESAGSKLDQLTLAILADPKIDPQEKAWRSAQFLNRRQGERRCRQAISEAEQILAMGIPDPKESVTGAGEFALFTMYSCYRQLNQDDLAMQAGEKMLARYPTGTWYRSVEQGIREIVEWRKGEVERRAKLDARFAELDVKRAENEAALAKAVERRAELDRLITSADESKRRQLENERDHVERDVATAESMLFSERYERCWFPRDLDPARALDGCRAFVAQYPSPAKSHEKAHVRQAKLSIIQMLAELARWNEAIPAARTFLAEHREPEDKSNVDDLKSLLQHTWPADAAP